MGSKKSRNTKKRTVTKIKSRSSMGTRFLMLIGIQVVLLLGLATFLFFRGEPENEEAKRLSQLQRPKSVDDLKSEVESRFEWLTSQSVPAQMQSLTEQLEFADKIEKLDPSARPYADKIRLTAFSIMDGYNVQNQLGRQDIRNDLLKLCQKLANSDSDMQVRDAFFAVINANVQDLCHVPTESELSALEGTIDASFIKLPDDEIWIEKLKQCFKILESGKVPEQRRYLLGHVAKKLFASQNPQIRAQGLEFATQMNFENVNFAELDRQLKSGNSESIDLLRNHFDALISQPNVVAPVYKSLAALAERNAELIIENGLEHYLKETSTAIEKIVVPKVQQEIEVRWTNLLARWSTRNELFEFETLTTDGQKIANSDFRGSPIVLFYFSPRQTASATFISKLANLDLDVNQYQKIGVLLEQASPEQLGQIKNALSECLWIQPTQDLPFKSDFPVDVSPYLVVLDSEHRIVSQALDVEDLEQVVAKLETPDPNQVAAPAGD